MKKFFNILHNNIITINTITFSFINITLFYVTCVSIIENNLLCTLEAISFPE